MRSMPHDRGSERTSSPNEPPEPGGGSPRLRPQKPRPRAAARLIGQRGVWYDKFFRNSGWRCPGGSALRLVGGNNSVVECDLAKVEVAGSNPVSRSNIDVAPVGRLCALRCVGAWSPTPPGAGEEGTAARPPATPSRVSHWPDSGIPINDCSRHPDEAVLSRRLDADGILLHNL